jgi:hypothetical protein
MGDRFRAEIFLRERGAVCQDHGNLRINVRAVYGQSFYGGHSFDRFLHGC